MSIDEDFAPARDEAIRGMLVDYVTAHPARRRRRGLWATLLVLAGVVGGTGMSTAAFAATGMFAPTTIAPPAGEPTPQLPDPVPAPAGTEPGAPIISLLGTPITLRVAAAESVPLEPPAGATHVRVTITPVSAGSIRFGTDPGGAGPSGSWTESDLGPDAQTYYDFPLDDSVDALRFDARDGFTGVAMLQYVEHVPTRLAFNPHGESYGSSGFGASPDLVAVTGVAPDGSFVSGYARAADLEDFGPEHPGQPTEPAQALEWQAEREAAHPDGWDIPVYAADGETVVGTFHIGG